MQLVANDAIVIIALLVKTNIYLKIIITLLISRFIDGLLPCDCFFLMPLGYLVIKLFLERKLTLVEFFARLRDTLRIGDELRSMWNVSFQIRSNHAESFEDVCLLGCKTLDLRLLNLFFEFEIRNVAATANSFKVLVG